MRQLNVLQARPNLLFGSRAPQLRTHQNTNTGEIQEAAAAAIDSPEDEEALFGPSVMGRNYSYKTHLNSWQLSICEIIQLNSQLTSQDRTRFCSYYYVVLFNDLSFKDERVKVTGDHLYCLRHVHW